MKTNSWEDLLDDGSSSGTSSFIFTAANLKLFIQEHCKDPWVAARSLLAHAECIPGPYESSCAAIPRHRPRPLAFPLLDLPSELMLMIAKNIPTAPESPVLANLISFSMVSKSVRVLTFDLLFSTLWLNPSFWITRRTGFWEHHPGLRGSHLKDLEVSLPAGFTKLEEMCNNIEQLSRRGWNNHIRHISLSTNFSHEKNSKERKLMVKLGQILKDFDQLTSLEVVDCEPEHGFICLESLLRNSLQSLAFLELGSLVHLDDTICDALSTLPNLRIFAYSKYDSPSLKASPTWKFGIQELRVNTSDLETLAIVLDATSATLKSLILTHCLFDEVETTALDVPQMRHLSYVWFDNIFIPFAVKEYFRTLLGQESNGLRAIRVWMNETVFLSNYEDNHIDELGKDILADRHIYLGWNSLEVIFLDKTASCTWFGNVEEQMGIMIVDEFRT